MRLGQLVTPEALTLTIGGWSRSEIETAIEHLIELLDVSEASSVDLEPDAETCVSDGLPGDMSDAETDQPVMCFKVGRRLRR